MARRLPKRRSEVPASWHFPSFLQKTPNLQCPRRPPELLQSPRGVLLGAWKRHLISNTVITYSTTLPHIWCFQQNAALVSTRVDSNIKRNSNPKGGEANIRILVEVIKRSLGLFHRPAFILYASFTVARSWQPLYTQRTNVRSKLNCERQTALSRA